MTKREAPYNPATQYDITRSYYDRSTLGPAAIGDMRACELQLGRFMQRAWRHANEPMEFQSNWHIDCMVDHLTAVADQQIGRLLIFTMPPRHMKSVGNNVFFPAWLWTQPVNDQARAKGLAVNPGTWRGPGAQVAYISYDQELSNLHSNQCRTLMESPWYQERWGTRFRLVEKRVEYYSNTMGGSRRALSFAGKLTGFGAHLIFIDDAHNIMSDSYESDRIKVLEAWDNALPSRLNDRMRGTFILSMQRSKENDLVGHVLAKEFNGIHVCLPAEYEGNHPFVYVKNPDPKRQVIRKSQIAYNSGGPPKGEIWYDTRAEGEPLWKERFPKEALLELQAAMTSHAAAGQYQQRPTAREGGLFKREWFESAMVTSVPDSAQRYVVRAWDLAASLPKPGVDPDYTVGVLMCRDPVTKVHYILNVIRGRWSPADVESKIKSTALMDGEEVQIVIPKDPAQAGKFQAYYFVTQLQGFRVSTPTIMPNSKETKAEPFAAQCEHGNVKLLKAPWNDKFIDELCAFSENCNHDDQVDAATAGFRALMSGRGLVVA